MNERASNGWLALLIIGLVTADLGDRLITGQVTDFLFLDFFPFVFNVADMAITAGGVVLAFQFLRGEEPVMAGVLEGVRG